MEQKKVQVLMSTYNGQRYVEQQVRSILNQTWENLELLIRDDGSSDETVSILKRLAEEDARIRLFIEKNVGSNRSFFQLLRVADADYVAFADQDDYWLPEKIEKAVEALQNHPEALLYCGNKILTDAELVPMEGVELPDLKPSFEGAVVESICTGCTSVLTRRLVWMVCEHLPKYAIVHDWWVYLVATYYGEVYFDQNAYMYYRQHESNQIGAADSFIGTLKAKKKYLDKSRGLLKAQLQEFKEHNRGREEYDALVDDFLASEDNAKIRRKLALSNRFHRQSGLDQMVVRALILTKRFL